MNLTTSSDDVTTPSGRRFRIKSYTFAVQARRTTYETIVWSRRGQAHTRRGRPRTRARRVRLMLPR